MKRIKNLTAEQLRKSILQLAIQGKLVSQNAEDGNAKDLLAEIKNEKAKLIKEGKIKKEKPLPEITADEIPFEIPEGWFWCRLGEICKFISRGKSPKYSDIERIPVFAQKCNLKDGEISLEQSKFLDPAVIHKWKDEYKILDGDILINSTGTGTVMRTRLFKNEYLKNYLFVVPDSHITIVRTFDLIVSKFIYLFCRSFIVQKYWEENLAGSTNQKELYVSAICNTIIPLPPLAEQKRIVEKIESLEPLLKEYEKYEKALTELDDKFVEKCKKSILQYAICGKLVPQDPTDEPVSELVSKIRGERDSMIKQGKLKKDKNESYIYKGEDGLYYEKIGKAELVALKDLPFEIPESWVWVRQKNLCWLDNGVETSGEKLPYLEAKVIRGITDPTYKTSGVCVEPNQKVILVDGENSGEIMTPKFKGYLGSTFKIFSVVKNIDYNYLLNIFMLYRDKYKNSKTGSAIPHLNKELFRELLIPLPPLAEQKRIVVKIEEIFEQLKRIKI